MKIRLYYHKLVLFLISILLFAAPVTQVLAYSTPYYVTRLDDPSLSGYQDMQIVAVGNTVYVSSYTACYVHKIINNTDIEPVAGISGSCGYSPDGSIATKSTLQGPSSIAVGSDGTVYIAEPYQHHVRAVLPDGTLSTVAGNGNDVDGSLLTDAPDARQTPFDTPTYLKMGPDNNLYIYDSGVIRRILPNGSTDHVAGAFNAPPYVEGGISTQHAIMPNVISTTMKFAFDQNGNIFYGNLNESAIYEVYGSDDTAHTFSILRSSSINTLEDEPLANATLGTSDGFDIDSQGQIWTEGYDNTNGTVISIRHISLSDQIVKTAAGGGSISIPPLLYNDIPTLGTSLSMSNVIKSISVNNGRVYFLASYTDSRGVEPYIGIVSQGTLSPSVRPSLSQSPDSNGWNSSPVTLNWIVKDSDSPITNQTSCSPTVITSTGTYTCTATSAGGTTSQSITVKVDPTPPVIKANLSPAPNSNGWNNSATTISWDVGDPESPITGENGCDTAIDNTELASATYTCIAESGGGLSSQSVTIKLDKTAPTVSTPTVSGGVTLPLVGSVLLSNGTISTNVADNLSGVAGGEFYADTDPGQGHGTPLTISGGAASATVDITKLSAGPHNLYVRDYDKAGNWSAVSTPVVVTIL